MCYGAGGLNLEGKIHMKVLNLFVKTSFCVGLIFLTQLNVLHADEFPWTPPKNFTFKPSYVAVHHPVATQQKLAQLYFDQGLTFLYAFNHDAAYWSFLKASEVDHDMPMAYWGMALVIGSNINMETSPERAKAAYELVQKAMQKASNGLEVEKDYIQALAQRYSLDPKIDNKMLAANYSQAMQKLSQKYMDDPDAAVLYAESLLDVSPWDQWDKDGKPLPGTEAAIQSLQSVLQRNPNHLGANHYYIHVIEASLHPEIALMSAERLKTLLPSSGHILHMPSHIYLLVGDYAQAVQSNIEAIAADRQYIKEYGLDGIYPLHYLSHNLFFITRAYTLEGRYEDAKQTADELVAFYAPHFQKMKELEYYLTSPLTVLITFNRWKEILDLPVPKENMQMMTALWHFGRSLAFANLGNKEQASHEQSLFLERKKQIEPNLAFGYNRSNQILDIAELSLDAKIAETRGNLDQAIDFLQNAVSIQDSLKYNEPPDWFYPIRETLGGLFLRMQKPKEAEEVLRQELNRHPQNGRALFGLRESLKAQSKIVDSYWVDKEFQKAWQYSTTPLTIKNL